jgi:hypothetical protein
MSLSYRVNTNIVLTVEMNQISCKVIFYQRGFRMHTAKQSARELIDQLPDSATWNDLIYELYVKQKVEEGLAELDAGKSIPHAEVKRRLLDNHQS